MSEIKAWDLVVWTEEDEPPLRQMFLSKKAAKEVADELSEDDYLKLEIQEVTTRILSPGSDYNFVSTSDNPLAKAISDGVGYSRSRNQSPKKGGNLGATKTTDKDEFRSKEEQDMSKTSQSEKNKKVAKAMQGQKAAKNGSKPRKEKAEYNYTPIPSSFKGNVHKVQTNGKVVSPVHAVEDGQTKCGYSTTEQSKGDKHYELQFVKTNEEVTCKRCMAEPKPAKEKKPTPIKSAKSAKKAKKEKATAAAE